MARIKQRNPVVFDEKLLHRYLWEMYYEDSRKIRSLLPDKWRDRARDLNLVVPEKVTDQGYNADLALYFRGHQGEVLVEVKWQPSGFTGSHQIEALRQSGGFGVVLGASELVAIPGTTIPLVCIDRGDFLQWLARNISRLAERTLEAKSLTPAELAPHRRDWLLVIKRGQMRTNFDRMIQFVRDNPRTNPFWAFRKKSATMRQLLHVRRGDRVVILDAHIPGTPGHEVDRSREAARRNSLDVARWHLVEVRTPYFMVIDPEEPLGRLYEAGDPAIGDRLFPHFIDFAGSLTDHGPTRIQPVGVEFNVAFADSWSQHSGPLVPLHPDVSGALIDALRAGSSTV